MQALIIVPTRELAVQISQELKLLGKLLQVNVQAIYGGVDMRHQIVKLKNKPQIVVGTPGRILDHINRHILKLSNVNYLVVDEADEILKMGFIDDLEKFLIKFLRYYKQYFYQQLYLQNWKRSLINFNIILFLLKIKVNLVFLIQ